MLDDNAIFWINILGVWCLSLLGLYLSVYVSLMYGLAVAYLTVLNGVSHILMAIAKRRFNPGFWTSLLLFLPVGGYALYALSVAENDRIHPSCLRLGVALVVHGAILFYVRGRLKEIQIKAAPTHHNRGIAKGSTRH